MPLCEILAVQYRGRLASALTVLHCSERGACCRAKNFVPGKEGQSTKVAAAVIDLQRALPMARTVYCSATGVSEVGHMAYMDRMGLWGLGSAFADFEAFIDSMKHRGVSFLEMLAMEMKSEGKYVARGLSFKNAEFVHEQCVLEANQVCFRAVACRPDGNRCLAVIAVAQQCDV